jgi:hypothetical protein
MLHFIVALRALMHFVRAQPGARAAAYARFVPYDPVLGDVVLEARRRLFNDYGFWFHSLDLILFFF